MTPPRIPAPYGYREAKLGETPEFFAYVTIVSQQRTDCTLSAIRLMADTARVHPPESDTLLRSHLASAKRDDLSVEDYRALMHRAFRRLMFLEWQHANPDDTEAYLKETEDRRFEFSNGSDIWEGYQNDPDSWENATHYRPEVLPGR